MESTNSRKIKLLKIWDILCRETDSENPMPSRKLIARLSECGIEVDRKILYDDIKVLNDWGYEIMCRRSSSNEYYVEDRTFDMPEIQILMDAVQAAGFITEKKTKALVGKIAQLAGSGKAAVLKQNIVEFGTVKTANENVLYSVNEINAAINRGCKISFLYFDYDFRRERAYRKDEGGENAREYVVSPLATVFSNDRYYLLCHSDKHDGIVHYRVDRMDRVRLLDENIEQGKKAAKLGLSKHKKQVFEMFGGELAKVTLRVDATPRYLDVIFDAFGDDVRLRPLGDGTAEFTVEVEVSPTFLSWCCSLGDKMKVVAPYETVERVKEFLESTARQYK